MSSVCQKEHGTFYAPFTRGREQVYIYFVPTSVLKIRTFSWIRKTISEQLYKRFTQKVVLLVFHEWGPWNGNENSLSDIRWCRSTLMILEHKLYFIFCPIGFCLIHKISHGTFAEGERQVLWVSRCSEWGKDLPQTHYILFGERPAKPETPGAGNIIKSLFFFFFI